MSGDCVLTKVPSTGSEPGEWVVPTRGVGPVVRRNVSSGQEKYTPGFFMKGFRPNIFRMKILHQ